MFTMLSLIKSIPLTADTISLCTKKPVPTRDSHFPFDGKTHTLLLIWCHLRPIQPPVLPENLTYILIVFSRLS
jgi:hypothetical protein